MISTSELLPAQLLKKKLVIAMDHNLGQFFTPAALCLHRSAILKYVSLFCPHKVNISNYMRVSYNN